MLVIEIFDKFDAKFLEVYNLRKFLLQVKKILYPINLKIENQKCVVIGGGKVAYRKILRLLDSDAKVEVISPTVCTEIFQLAEQNKISLRLESYSAEKISTGLILIAATDNFELNKKILADGRAKNFLVNDVDGDGDFFVPSKIQRGDFLLTISTGGSSPAFAKFVRENLEAEFDENFGAGLEIISRYRQEVKNILQNHEDRKKFWRGILTPSMWKLLKNGELEKAEGIIKNALDSVGAELQNSTC